MTMVAIMPARGAWAVITFDAKALWASPSSIPKVIFRMAGTGAGGMDVAARHEADHGTLRKTWDDALAVALKIDPLFVGKQPSTTGTVEG